MHVSYNHDLYRLNLYVWWIQNLHLCLWHHIWIIFINSLNHALICLVLTFFLFWMHCKAYPEPIHSCPSHCCPLDLISVILSRTTVLIWIPYCILICTLIHSLHWCQSNLFKTLITEIPNSQFVCVRMFFVLFVF